MTVELVARLRSNRPIPTLPHEAADLIETQAAEIERLRDAMKGPLAWLERWAVHVGSCESKPECQCGLLFAQHELRNALEAKP